MDFQLPQNFNETQVREIFLECQKKIPERFWEFLAVSLDNPLLNDAVPLMPQPPWVVNLANILKKTFVFSIKENELDAEKPYEMGCSWGAIQSCLTLVRERPELAEPLTEQFTVLTACADEIIKSLFLQALTLPRSESSEFFRGFAEGLAELDSSGLPAKRTPSFLLYFVLLALRREVEKYESVPELFAWLTTVVHQSIVGDLENFQRTCGRIELKLASPGRPKIIK